MNYGIESRRVGTGTAPQFPISVLAQMDEGDPFSRRNYVAVRTYFRDFAVRIALIAPGTIVPEDRAILYPPRGCRVSRYEIERARMLSSAILIREIR